MARPKGSDIDDRNVLRTMAALIVDGKAGNPWQAAGYAMHLCTGASEDATRRRLIRKYRMQRSKLEFDAGKTRNYRDRFAHTSNDPMKHAVESMHRKWDSDAEKLDAILADDPEIREIVQASQVGDLPLADLLPDILDRIAHRWVKWH